MSVNLILCGVGGQGTVLASKLLAGAAMNKGMTVKSAETIGMAQKGGSVVSYIHIGDDAQAPLIARGQADAILAFEPAEAVRMLPYLKKDGAVIVNRDPVIPVNMSLAGKGYEGDDMIAYLKTKTTRVVAVDGSRACRSLGSPKVLNMVLLGKLLRENVVPFTADDMICELSKRMKPALVELNGRALSYEEV